MTRSTHHVVATYGTAIAALLLFVFFAVAANNFVNPTNLLNIGKQVSFLAILGIGFSIAFTAAELDLSFAAVCSLCAVVVGGLVFHKVAPVLAVAAALGVGLAAGVVNGLLVTALRIPSLIATLAMASVATGIAFAITGGVAFVGRWDPAFLALGRGSVLGIPALILWTAAVAIVVQFVLKQTRLGLHLVFTGEADEAARLAGVKIKRMKVIALAFAGALRGARGNAPRRHAQLGRARHGEGLSSDLDRRGAARHDHVRARTLQRSRARWSAPRPSACSATGSC